MNKEFVSLTHETKEKTRQRGLESEEGPSDKCMYATIDPITCPVHALKFFLRKTDPHATTCTEVPVVPFVFCLIFLSKQTVLDNTRPTA